MSALPHAETPPRGRAGFELRADGPDGPVRLSWAPGVDDAASAAVALRDHADWIAALEDWLAPADGLDWAAAERAPSEDGTGWILASADCGGRTASLSLPWPLIRRLPAPPRTLGLRWPALDSELVLARQAFPPEDWSSLAPGSVLLMEDSFAAAWLAMLRRSGDQSGRWLRFDGRSAQLDAIENDDGAQPREDLEVRLTLSEPVPVPVLAGWPHEEAGRSLAPDPSLPLTLHVRGDGHTARPVAEGHLLPWGRGHAMRITHLLADPVTLRSQPSEAPRTEST